MGDNRDQTFELFSELPADVRAIIIALSAEDPKAFSTLLATSKEVAARAMQALQNPFILFRLLCTSSEKEKAKLIRIHFSPDSPNYRAIEAAALNKGDFNKHRPELYQQAAIVCFALMMNEKYSAPLNDLDVKAALQSLEEFAAKNNQVIPRLAWIYQNIITRATYLGGKGYRQMPLSTQPVSEEIYINLSGVKLRGYFHNGDFRCVNFRDAELSEIHLQCASLIDADLTNAVLDRANVGNANCDGVFAEKASFKCLSTGAGNLSYTFILTTFRGAKLAGADFSGTKLDRIDFTDADLRRVNFSNTTFIMGGIFTNANVEDADFHKAFFEINQYSDDSYYGVDFSGVNLKGTNFSESTLSGMRMHGADFSGANFSAAIMTSLKATSANFSGANLRGAQMSGGNFEAADFTGANFQFAQLYNVNFRNAKLDNARFIPDEAYQDPKYLEAALDGFQKLSIIVYSNEVNEESLLAIRNAVFKDLYAHTKDPALLKVAENHAYFKGMKVQLVVEEVKKETSSLISSVMNFFKGSDSSSSSSSSASKGKGPEKKGP